MKAVLFLIYLKMELVAITMIFLLEHSLVSRSLEFIYIYFMFPSTTLNHSLECLKGVKKHFMSKPT